jgi:hypothetical protein
VQDSAGNMWIGTPQGASRFEGIGWESFDTSNGLGGNIVYDIAVDTDGSIWFGTNAGVSHFIENTSPVELKQQAETIPNYNLKIYPNPFDIQTTILFSTPEDNFITLTIYNLLGQPIRKLLHENLKMGSHAIVWNGKNEQGSDVSTGIYLVRITGENLLLFQKIVVVK